MHHFDKNVHIVITINAIYKGFIEYWELPVYNNIMVVSVQVTGILV